MFPYVPGIKGMQHVHLAGFRLDQVLKLILTTPVQVKPSVCFSIRALVQILVSALSPYPHVMS